MGYRITKFIIVELANRISEGGMMDFNNKKIVDCIQLN